MLTQQAALALRPKVIPMSSPLTAPWLRFAISWLAQIALAVWFGGFTFYAAVVIPIGEQVLDATTQGFVTQRVTGPLNLIGIACLLLLAIDVWQQPQTATRTQAIWFGIMFAGLCGLFAVHTQLDRMLSPADFSVTDTDAFYRWHQVYLWISCMHWAGGLIWYGWGRVSISAGEADATACPTEHASPRSRP